MIEVVEARDLVQKCIGRASSANRAQPGTGTMVLYDCLAAEIEQLLTQRAVALLCPPFNAETAESVVHTYELHLATLSLVTLVWTFWVLESKGIWHKGEPATGWRYVLEKKIIDVIDELLKDARNQAIDDKKTEQAQGAVPSNLEIPNYYQDWREKIGPWS